MKKSLNVLIKIVARMAIAAVPQICSNVFKGVQDILCVLRLLCHIQVCLDAIVWRLKLRRRVSLIFLLSTLSNFVL